MSGNGPKPAASAAGARPIWPEWLVKAVGVDYFGHVAAVYLTQRCDDDTLAQVAKLDRLASLEISCIADLRGGFRPSREPEAPPPLHPPSVPVHGRRTRRSSRR